MKENILGLPHVYQNMSDELQPVTKVASSIDVQHIGTWATCADVVCIKYLHKLIYTGNSTGEMKALRKGIGRLTMTFAFSFNANWDIKLL